MRENPKPYLRSDLTEGAETRARIESDDEWSPLHPAVLRLLDTIDNLYEHTDRVTKDAEHWRNNSEMNASALKVERKKAFAQLGEPMNLRSVRQSNADRYAALPEDVQALQEEAAAWKDEYANMKMYRDNVKRSDDHRGLELDKAKTKVQSLKRKLRKLRKIHKDTTDLAVGQAIMIQNRDNSIVALGETTAARVKAVEDALCLENKDHDNLIAATVRSYELWLGRGMTNPLDSHVNAFLADRESMKYIQDARFKA